MTQLRTYIIGETGLCVTCMEMLHGNSYNIVGVVTKSSEAQKFATKNGIPFFASVEEAQEHILRSSFDYLFSIANPVILPLSIIKQPLRLAINYHDSILPSYAGSHATSWAILNNEHQHGVSWHIMDSKLDAGALLKQHSFPINTEETTYSLNAKCFEIAVSSFKELICEIQQGKIKKQTQNEHRTFYYKHQKPENGGFIHWNLPAKKIDQLCRALFFGSYSNGLATAKILIDRSLYFPSETYSEYNNKKVGSPGEVLSISRDCIKIAAKMGVVVVSKLLDSKGNIVDLGKIAKLHKLKKGGLLPVLMSDQLIELQNQVQNSSMDEDYWLNECRKISVLGVPWGGTVQDSRIYEKKISLSQVLRNKNLDLEKKFYQIASVFLVYLSRLMGQRDVSVRWGDSKKNEITIKSFKVLNCHIHHGNLSDCITNVTQKIEQIECKSFPLKDLAYRYGQENIALPVQIIITEKDEDFNFDEETLFQLSISQKFITIKGRIPFHSVYAFENIVSQFFSLISESLYLNQVRVQDIPIMDKKSQEQLIDWNKTQVNYQHKKCIHQLFEEQVNKAPDSIAIVYESNQMTYAELNRRANRLARYLQSLPENNAACDRIIGILIDRSFEMIISMLACLKSGFSYLPVDTDYPGGRIDYIFQDANVSSIITKKVFLSKLSSVKQTILVDDLELSEDHSNLGFYRLNFLIYVLYTSGSTGLPKGSGLTHKSVSNLLNWYVQEFEINRRDSILIFTAFGFDLTQKNILGGLIAGSKINLLDNGRFDAIAIVNYINKHCISFVNCPPSPFYALVDQKSLSQFLSSLRIVLLGGESIKPEKINDFLQTQNCKIINTYGPTECSDLALTHTLTKEEVKKQANIPLGRNVGNVTIYIFDKQLCQVPIGCIGEIYLGGMGLGIGYLNKPTLTAEIFIANPFDVGTRLYKTGDLGRYLPNGNVEFCGRVDYQVKVRGFRIELGEIENVLSEFDGVSQCVVIAREDKSEQKKLVAYVVPSRTNQLTEAQFINLLRKLCEHKLPGFMCPGHIIILEQLPLTPNGKIDRKALPQPERGESGLVYRVPKGSFERSLAKIWSSLLGIKKISANANFFNLGGDSIIAIKVIALMKKEGFHLTVNDLYQYKTISEIGSKILQQSTDEHIKYQPFSLIRNHLYNNSDKKNRTIVDNYPATYMQKGLLLESLLDSSAYHDIFSYIISSTFDLERFVLISLGIYSPPLAA
jgi:amino acid adenylation domain-containing protein